MCYLYIGCCCLALDLTRHEWLSALQTVASEGTMAEVSSARDVFSGVVKGLQQEAAARRKAVEELKAQLAKQVRREGEK